MYIINWFSIQLYLSYADYSPTLHSSSSPMFNPCRHRRVKYTHNHFSLNAPCSYHQPFTSRLNLESLLNRILILFFLCFSQPPHFIFTVIFSTKHLGGTGLRAKHFPSLKRSYALKILDIPYSCSTKFQVFGERWTVH